MVQNCITLIAWASSTHQRPPTNTSKQVDTFTHRDDSYSDNNAQTRQSEEEVASINAAGTLHYYPATDKEAQIRKHVSIRQNITAQVKRYWSAKKKTISAKVQKYKKALIEVPSRLLSMKNGYPENINITEHCIVHLNANTELVSFTLYHRDSKK